MPVMPVPLELKPLWSVGTPTTTGSSATGVQVVPPSVDEPRGTRSRSPPRSRTSTSAVSARQPGTCTAFVHRGVRDRRPSCSSRSRSPSSGATSVVLVLLVAAARRRRAWRRLRGGAVVRADAVLGRLACVGDLVELAACDRCRSRASRAGTSPRRRDRSARRRCRSRPPSPMFAPELHERPEAGRVLRAAGVARRVVEIRQAEVVRVLVREDAEAAVLGLDGVVADPDAGRVVRDRRTARETPPLPAFTPPNCESPAGPPARGTLRVPAVAPDRVRALLRVAGRLVAAGVDDLEVIDEAVRLVEVAVAVEVVAIPDVERLQVGLRSRPSSCRQSSWPWTQNAIASRIRNQVLLQTMPPQKSRP